MSGANDVTLDYELPLPELLKSVERQIATSPVEICFAFNEQKQLVLTKTGETNRIAFTPLEQSTLSGSYFTHNHPGGGFFSWIDIGFAHEHNLRQLRVVSHDVVHILSPGENGWNLPHFRNVCFIRQQRFFASYKGRVIPKRVADNFFANKLPPILIKELALAYKSEVL